MYGHPSPFRNHFNHSQRQPQTLQHTFCHVGEPVNSHCVLLQCLSVFETRFSPLPSSPAVVSSVGQLQMTISHPTNPPLSRSRPRDSKLWSPRIDCILCDGRAQLWGVTDHIYIYPYNVLMICPFFTNTSMMITVS